MKKRFAVPDGKMRTAAIGSLAGLTPGQKRAYLEPDKFFSPVEDPGLSSNVRYWIEETGGWLASHSETPQTFDVLRGCDVW